MARIDLTIDVGASPEICFDLSRNIDFHMRTLEETNERAVAGRTSGLIEIGETVTWRGRHFGFYLHHTAKITRFDRPSHFRDEMTAGWFSSFVHDHHFEAIGAGTRMRDIVEFHSPAGPVGRAIDRWLVTDHLSKLIRSRQELIRLEAEKAN